MTSLSLLAGRTVPEGYKKILSLSIRLKVLTNKPSQHTMSDQYYRSASKTPFKWHFVGGPTLARFFMFSGIYNA